MLGGVQPPLSVIPHRNFEELVEAIISEGWMAAGSTPLPQPIIVPSLPFSDYLQLRLADKLGVCMGFDFLTSRDFIQRATELSAENPWSPRHLCWQILSRIDACADNLGVNNPSPRDRMALSGLLADQFDQYAHFRPEIIRSWAAGRPALPGKPSPEDKAAEQWQRELWTALNAGSPHPVVEFAALREDPNFRKRLAADFPRLLVLGSGVIDPLLVEMLGLLAQAGGRVAVHLVLPSLEFLGDLRSRNVLPPEESDPEDMASMDGHPLLNSMGRHAIGTFLLLGRLDDQYSHWPEPERRETRETSVLRQLQSDIQNLRQPAAVGPVSDASIRVHSCFGPRREMEVLKDEILRAFEELPDLKPEEIHLVTPSLETYAPLVSAVLERGAAPLSVRLMEVPMADRAPFVEGVLALLEMCQDGQFEASRLMELLQREAVQAALGVLDDTRGIERMRDWIRDSGLTRGFAAETETDAAPPGTWSFARDRLVAGRWFGTDESRMYPGGDFVLAVADELAGGEELRARFTAWLAALEFTMREWRVMAPAAVWAHRISALRRSVLSGDDDALLAIQPQLTFLRSVDCPEPVDAGTLLDWLEAESGRAARRTQISGRIPFGRLRQLQNIPCRVLAMVGMEDARFPAQNCAPAWDLLRKNPRVWDRNPRIDDRQLFLDAILAPQDRLIVTASTRNVRTRKSEPFSSCVDELLRVVETMGVRRENLVTMHRLQPFASDYFIADTKLPHSYSPEFARVAGAFHDDGKKQPFWQSGDDATPQQPSEISLTQLLDCWKNPAKFFLKAQGIFSAGDPEDDEALDRAEACPDNLSTWSVKQAIVDAEASADGNLALTQARLRANRGLPPGHLGSLAWKTGLELGRPVGRALRQLRGGTESSACEVPDFPALRITGEISLNQANDHLLASRAGEFKDVRHYLEPWIAAIFASCCGRPLPTLLLDETCPERPKEMPLIPEAEAREILSRLVSGFLKARTRPLCFAPEASAAYEKALRKAGSPAALGAASAAWNLESDYKKSGEGTTPEARWAWRDRDPFAPDEAEAWNHWAEKISVPLRAWGGWK